MSDYPLRKGKFYWIWPWHLNRWYYFFFHEWGIVSSNGKSYWHGVVIFGFKKVNRVWLIGPKEAEEITNRGIQKMLRILEGKEDFN
mgnify:CR=1 FL=1